MIVGATMVLVTLSLGGGGAAGQVGGRGWHAKRVGGYHLVCHEIIKKINLNLFFSYCILLKACHKQFSVKAIK